MTDRAAWRLSSTSLSKTLVPEPVGVNTNPVFAQAVLPAAGDIFDSAWSASRIRVWLFRAGSNPNVRNGTFLTAFLPGLGTVAPRALGLGGGFGFDHLRRMRGEKAAQTRQKVRRWPCGPLGAAAALHLACTVTQGGEACHPSPFTRHHQHHHHHQRSLNGASVRFKKKFEKNERRI